MAGIYKITSPSGKVYIGQSWNIPHRLRRYKYLDCKRQTLLFASINKYGWDAHKAECICELPVDIDQKILDDYEIFYWNQYKECGFKMLNLREPGARGKHTEETKKKMSKSSKGRKHTEESKRKLSEHRKGKKLSSEHVEKIRITSTGRFHSEETKKKMSKWQIGIKRNPESVEKTAASKRGKKMSKEACEKMRQAQLGRKHSPETILKMKENAKLLWQKRKNKIII